MPLARQTLSRLVSPALIQDMRELFLGQSRGAKAITEVAGWLSSNAHRAAVMADANQPFRRAICGARLDVLCGGP